MIEVEFSKHIEQILPNVTKQLRLSNGSNRWFYYDVCYRNRIIEFHGDFWHARDNENVCTEKRGSLQEIRDRDERKKVIAESNGYELMEIWEGDYKKDKQGIIEKCIRFLTQ